MARTEDGHRCKRDALTGRFCWQHGPKDPTVEADDGPDNTQRAKILTAIERGASPKMAAEGAGVSEGTLRWWRDNIEGFDTDCREAKAKGATKLLGSIQSAADTDWRAAAWLLEKGFPETFGDRDDTVDKPDTDNDVDDDLEVNWDELSRSEADDFIEMVERIGLF